MKKTTLLIVIMMTTFSIFAVKVPSISVEQTVQFQGGMYGNVSVPAIPQGTGLVNVLYDITVVGKNRENAVIDCCIKMPSDLNVEILAAGGIQKLKTKDNSEVQALSVYNEGEFNIIEFLIPQQTTGRHFIELQFDTTRFDIGRNLPVFLNFSYYESNIFSRMLSFPKFVISSGIAGIVSYSILGGVLSHETLNDIKSKYKSTPIEGIYRYAYQIVE